MRQVQIEQYGGPEVLRLVEVPDPQPGPRGAGHCRQDPAHTVALSPQRPPTMSESEPSPCAVFFA